MQFHEYSIEQFNEWAQTESAILLKDFINAYPKRREIYRYCTSWTSYSITQTDEETLVHRVMQDVGEGDEYGLKSDWLRTLQIMFLELTRYYYPDPSEDARDDFVFAGAQMLGDAFADQSECFAGEIMD